MKEWGHCQLLGTGASAGIPVIGCKCDVCQSADPYNKRLRPSALVKAHGKILLIDPCPDFRQQALKYSVDRLDGVLITHVHFDHTGGIDDLRAYYVLAEQPLPCLVPQHTFDDLLHRYYYLFQPRGSNSSLPAQLKFQILEGTTGVAEFLGVQIGYFSYAQGGVSVTGYRFGDFAYISDIREYPETIFDDLQGVRVLVLSALRFTPSHLHFSVDEAIDFSEKVGAEEVYLTHIAHDIDHEKGSAYLPSNVSLGYDGLSFDFFWEK